MKRTMFAAHENDVRKSVWFLVQDDAGALSVEQNAEYPDGTAATRTISINEFMTESGPPPRALQAIIDRMFDGG
jgi:hypothetical protein